MANQFFILILIVNFIFCEEKKNLQTPFFDSFKYNQVGKIGDNPFPTNPMSDRAIGYLLQGKAQTAISNYGNIINWDEHPMGIWNGYSYLPSVAFLAGVPGHQYSYTFSWNNTHRTPYTISSPQLIGVLGLTLEIKHLINYERDRWKSIEFLIRSSKCVKQ